MSLGCSVERDRAGQGRAGRAYDGIDGTVQVAREYSVGQTNKQTGSQNGQWPRQMHEDMSHLLMLRLFFLEPNRPCMKTMGAPGESAFAGSW